MPGRNSAGKKSRAASAPAPSSRWRANYRNPLDSWELLSAHPTMPRMDLPNGVEIPRHRFIAYPATIPTRNMPHPERFNREGWAVSVTNCGEADPFPSRYVNEKFPTWVAIRTDYRLSCFNKWHLCSPYIWVGMYFTPIEDRRHSRQAIPIPPHESLCVGMPVPRIDSREADAAVFVRVASRNAGWVWEWKRYLGRYRSG